MTKVELYTFGEVVKLLGVDSNQVNQLIQAGKLKPVRHEGSLKFKKSDIDALQSPAKISPAKELEQQEKVKYSWDDVLRELQIEDQELKELISDGEIQVYKEQGAMKFDKDEIDEYKNARQVDMTIVVEKHDQEPEVMPEEIMEIHEPANMEVPISPLSESKYSAPAKQPISSEKYYSFDEVLTKLQIEAEQLEKMLADGELTAYHEKGEMKFKQAEIDEIRHGRMIDATMVVEKAPISTDSSYSLKLDEEIQPIVIEEEPITPIKARNAISKDAKPIAITPEDTKQTEFYSFEQALYELQIDAGELRRMIDYKEIKAIREPNGKFKFKKQDIDARQPKIEPTVILPEGMDEDQEDEPAVIIPKRPAGEAVTANEKSFYTLSEASQLLGITGDALKAWMGQKKIQLYMHEGERKIKHNDFLILKEAVSIGKQQHIIAQEASNEPDKEVLDAIPLEITAEELEEVAEEKPISVAPSKIEIKPEPPQAKPSSIATKPAKSSIPAAIPAPPTKVSAPPQPLPKVSTQPQPPSAPPETKPLASPPGKDSKDWASLEETLKILQIDQQGLRLLVGKGQLSAQKVGAKYYFNRQQALALAEKKGISAPAATQPAAPVAKPVPVAKPAPVAKAEPKPVPVAKAPAPEPKPVPVAKAPEPKSVAKPIGAESDDTYTMQEAMQLLSIGKNDIQRLVNEKHITLLPGNRIRKSELDALKKRSDVEITMVLPLSPDENEDESEEESPMLLTRPSSAPSPMPSIAKPASTLPTKSGAEIKKAEAIHPQAKAPASAVAKAAVTKPAIIPTATEPKKSESARPQPKPAVASINLKDYYTFQDVLTELQLEASDLQAMIQRGDIKSFQHQGKQYLKKEEVDHLKKGKMIEPTIMVDQGENILEEDDDDTPFLRS